MKSTSFHASDAQEPAGGLEKQQGLAHGGNVVDAEDLHPLWASDNATPIVPAVRSAWMWDWNVYESSCGRQCLRPRGLIGVVPIQPASLHHVGKESLARMADQQRAAERVKSPGVGQS